MEDRIGAAGGAAEDRAPGIPPVRAFVILGAVATIVPLTILATRPEAAPSSPPAPVASRGDFSLTDAEAIAEFEQLHRMFRSASRNRDVSLLRLMLVPVSPLRASAERQLRQLIDDDVLDRSRFTTEAVNVVRNTSDRIVVEQVVTIDPLFVKDSTGEVLTKGPLLRQRVSWTLAPDEGSWKVYDSVVLKSWRVR